MTTQYQGVSCLLYSQFHVCDIFTTLFEGITSRLDMEVTSLTNSRYTWILHSLVRWGKWSKLPSHWTWSAIQEHHAFPWLHNNPSSPLKYFVFNLLTFTYILHRLVPTCMEISIDQSVQNPSCLCKPPTPSAPQTSRPPRPSQAHLSASHPVRVNSLTHGPLTSPPSLNLSLLRTSPPYAPLPFLTSIIMGNCFGKPKSDNFSGSGQTLANANSTPAPKPVIAAPNKPVSASYAPTPAQGRVVGGSSPAPSSNDPRVAAAMAAEVCLPNPPPYPHV